MGESEEIGFSISDSGFRLVHGQTLDVNLVNWRVEKACLTLSNAVHFSHCRNYFDLLYLNFDDNHFLYITTNGSFEICLNGEDDDRR